MQGLRFFFIKSRKFQHLQNRGQIPEIDEEKLLTEANEEHENETKYLRYDDLSAFEKFSNWHYDLDVNLPGLEISISKTLNK